MLFLGIDVCNEVKIEPVEPTKTHYVGGEVGWGVAGVCLCSSWRIKNGAGRIRQEIHPDINVIN